MPTPTDFLSADAVFLAGRLDRRRTRRPGKCGTRLLRDGARVMIDGAQSVSHIPVNVLDIGCDFFVLSGHQGFGPTGIGVVFSLRSNGSAWVHTCEANSINVESFRLIEVVVLRIPR
jgi:hypothetical protein